MDKPRKIAFFELVKDMRANNSEGVTGLVPFDFVDEVITFILSKKGKARNYHLKNDKICSIESATIKKVKDKNGVEYVSILGLFKSAQCKYRPRWWDIQTDEERDSQKKLTEGDKEKTHFAIKITKEEVLLIVEINGNGITSNNIVNYINEFTKLYLKSQKKKKNFTVDFLKIGKDDINAEINKLNRARSAEVFFDKALLGGRALMFSDNTISVKKDLKLVLTAEPKESIKSTVIDIYNYFRKGKKSPISKIRILGKDEEGKDITIDTSFFEKIESISVLINESTGQVQTTSIYSYFKMYMNE